MKARMVATTDVIKIVDLLSTRGYQVIGLFQERGADTFFEPVTNENRSRLLLHGANPCYPPKRFVLPHIERLLTISKADDDPTVAPTYDETKRAIFGVRSCDVAGIDHLDRFYLGKGYRDTYYERRRKNLFLVNFVCTDAEQDVGDACFCVCTDTGPAARDHFDLQLMDLGSEYMAVAGTAEGEALFEDPIFRRATPEHVTRRASILNETRKRFKESTSWFSAAVRYVSAGETLDKTWEEIGNRCLECGGCSYVCPACTCFTVTDRSVSPGEIERLRIWDSCALSGFTRMAGGFNPRRAVHDRRNRRFFRKLAHYFIQRELSVACVGCGRCAAACHGDIGMPQVVEMIRRATAEKGKA